MKRITIISNIETNDWFFSTDHCQPMSNKNFVPCTHYLPQSIAPRVGFENGVLNSIDDIRRFENLYGQEIENPDSKYHI